MKIDFQKLKDAIQLAQDFHGNQQYGTRGSYIYHLNKVADVAHQQHSGDYTHMIVAYLHDILEDTECTYEIILENFGEEIAEAVSAITKIKDQSYDLYIARVVNNPLALKIKIYDTWCNMSECVVDEDWKRAMKYGKQFNLLVGYK